jgi:sulfatase maturation enzyme AslB (radical SAM superfamily)
MHCPRLDHFVRLNRDGSVGKCGHMIGAKGFASHEELQNSEWLRQVRNKMVKGEWPSECRRCQQSERTKGKSIRTNSIDRHKILYPVRHDYLIVGGVLDNICNSACQSCHAGLSTKIGTLESGSEYQRVDNYTLFESLPLHRIVELDVNGGEPTASKNYKKVLNDLPDNTRIVRMNTNGSRIIREIEDVLERGVKVIVTMSLDGTEQVHDYARWPIKWDDYKKTVDSYKHLQVKHKLLDLDFWTTVSCLNVEDLPNIQKFAASLQIPHDWAFLDQPGVLSVKHINTFTKRAKSLHPTEIAVDSDNQIELDEFIGRQDRLRGINVRNYFSFFPK